MESKSSVTKWLAGAPAAVFTAYAVTAAFGTYFCMYAFRKPFAVATFTGSVHLPLLPPMDLKTLYIIAQVLGYCASKFLGIKVVSEMRPERRALAIVACIGVAELALVLFGLAHPSLAPTVAVPAGPAGGAAIATTTVTTVTPWAALFLMLNGLPLGMIWGLVFGFLEGRRVSDLLGAGLCASFILASGVVKSVGKTLMMDWKVSEGWMPSATGALFFLPLLLFVWMLAQIPPPTAEDEALRTKRAPMDAKARAAFFRAHAGGLLMLIAGYMALTAYRDFRDNFAREIWDAVGYAKEPSILATAEIPVAFGALVSVGVMMGIRKNRTALMAIHAVMLAGAVLAGVSTLLYQAHAIGPVVWMISVGLGLYIGYVPFNCVLFDRLIAAMGSVATAGFLIYVADAFGYLGSVGLLLYKNFGEAKLSWLQFFLGFSYVSAIVCAALFVLSAGYFWVQTRGVGQGPAAAAEAEAAPSAEAG